MLLIEQILSLDYLSRFVLMFSNLYFVLVFIIFGYIFFNREVFHNLIYLVCLSILFNFALKVTFKVPLTFKPDGFAFPSGHMQFACVLYGYLSIFYRKIVIPVICLLVLIGWALVYRGYHNYFDVCGAIFSALIVIVAYMRFIRSSIKKKIIISTLLMIWIYWAWNPAWHVCYAYSVLIGLSVVEVCLTLKAKNKLV